MQNPSKIEKGMSNKYAAKKFKVPKNTISTWKKNSDKLFDALEKSSHSLKKQLESLCENERFRSLRQGDIRDFFH